MSEKENQHPTEREENDFSAFDENIRTVKESKKHRFSQRTRILLAAVAVVAALAITLTLILVLPHHTDVSSDSESTIQVYPMFDYSDDGESETSVVKSVSIQNENGSYLIRYQETKGEYELMGYEDLTLGSSASEMASCAMAVNGNTKINDSSDLKSFGLDSPAATVVISYFSHPDKTLLIGSAAPSGNGYYAKMSDQSEIYIIDGDVAEYFLKAATYFVDVTMMLPPSPNSDDTDGQSVLKALTLTGTDHPTPLYIRRSLPTDNSDYSFYEMVVTKPYFRGVKDTILESLSNFMKLSGNQAVVLHPTAAQKAEYGLANPSTVAEVTLAVETTEETESDVSNTDVTPIYYNESTTHLTVGNKDADGNYYAMIDGINAIFVVDASTLKPVVELQYETTISELLFIKDITTIQGLDITEGNKKYPFRFAHYPDKEDEDEQLVVTCNGKQYDTANFRLLYQWMMEITRYDEAATTNPTGAPDLSITVYNANGNPWIGFSFYQTSGSLYTVKASDGEIFSVKSSSVTALFNQMENYLNGKTVSQP